MKKHLVVDETGTHSFHGTHDSWGTNVDARYGFAGSYAAPLNPDGSRRPDPTRNEDGSLRTDAFSGEPYAGTDCHRHTGPRNSVNGGHAVQVHS